MLILILWHRIQLVRWTVLRSSDPRRTKIVKWPLATRKETNELQTAQAKVEYKLPKNATLFHFNWLSQNSAFKVLLRQTSNQIQLHSPISSGVHDLKSGKVLKEQNESIKQQNYPFPEQKVQPHHAAACTSTLKTENKNQKHKT